MGWRGGSRGWWRGGSGDLVGGDCDVEGCGEGDVGVGIFTYFAKYGELWERVEGGIGIAGEPRGCGEGDLGGGDLCLFRQARRVVGESGGGIGITGEPARCSVSVFFS